MPKTLAVKQREAAERAEKRARRSPADQLKIIEGRRGTSRKEDARLVMTIEAGITKARKKKKKG